MSTPASSCPPKPAPVPEGFDCTPHLRYRLHLQALLGLPILAVYDALRSLVWRSESYGPDGVVEHLLKGHLTAQADQHTLASMTGLGRSRISEHLKTLEHLGWLIALPHRNRRAAKIYELGFRRLENRSWVEQTHAETALRDWYSKAEAASLKDHTDHFKSLPAEQQQQIVYNLLLPLNVPLRNTNLMFRNPPQNTNRNTKTAQSGSSKINSLRHLKVVSPDAVDVPGENNEMFRAGTSTSGQRRSKLAELERKIDALTDYIQNLHKKPLTTFRENLRTTYSDSSLHSVRGGVPAFASDSPASADYDSYTRSLRSLVSESSSASAGSPSLQPEDSHSIFLEDAYASRVAPAVSLVHPALPNPTPVARPPFPSRSEFSMAVQVLGGGFQVERTLVTGAGAEGDGTTQSRQPQHLSQPQHLPLSEGSPQMPYKPPTTPRTSPDPTEGEIVRPDPASGDSGRVAGTLEELRELAEATKARSREAMETKLAKRRAKEQKRENLTSDRNYRSQKQAAQRLEGVWREQMARAFPDLPQIAWFKREGRKVLARKEGKLIADLLDGYGGDEGVVSDLIQTFVEHWGVFGPMLTKQTGSVPTVGLLCACHATVAAEGLRLRKRTDAVADYEKWKQDHAGNQFARPPTELEAAYKAAMAKKAKGKP